MVRASQASSDARKRIVLMVGLGTSPAILTETIWELAKLAKSVIPDEVVAITTKTGKVRLREQILSGDDSVWQRLRKALADEGHDLTNRLVFGETSIRVMPDGRGDEIDDLRTGADNLRAADFMLQQLRQYTEDPGTVVLTSIAGGRKTMSALLFSCMTLLGREGDRVYHILLPAPFEGGVEPPFYFPEKGVKYTARDGQTFCGSRVKGELFEVPYVRMRGWYQEKFSTLPPSYRSLVEQVQSLAPAAVVYPELKMDAWEGRLWIAGREIHLASTEFAALLLIARGLADGRFADRMYELHCEKGGTTCDWLSNFRAGSRFASSDCKADLSKVLSTLRKKLVAAEFQYAESLVPRRLAAVAFPVNQIKMIHASKLADICGCLSSCRED